MSRPIKHVVRLTDEEVAKLRSIMKNRKTTETVSNRCRILLARDENHPPVLKQRECAVAYGVSMSTINNIVARYCEFGLEPLLVLQRSVNSDNSRRKVDGRAEARIIEIACGPAPKGHSRWTLKLLEDQMKIVLDVPIGRETIRRTLKKTNFALTATNTGVYRK